MKKPINELKQSETILEIRSVDRNTKSQYAQAMKMEHKFPPIIITEDGTIVSGNHRYEAYLEAFGEDYEVDVEVRMYDNEVDLLEDAIQENLKHGKPLVGFDRRKAISTLYNYKRTPEQLSALFGITISRVEEIAGIEIVQVGREKMFLPVKDCLKHMHGQSMTKKEYKDHAEKDVSIDVYRTSEQLSRWLNAGYINLEDPRNVKALQQLHADIEKHVMELV